MRAVPVFLLSLFAAATARAELKLPAIFGDNMVLQQKQTNPIWGWDTPGTQVTVKFAGQTKSAKADDKGRWQVKLDPVPANDKAAVVSIQGSNARELKNVLVGEVWLCSGQSNMGFTVNRTWDADLEMAQAKYPKIRLIKVPNVGTQVLQDDFKGQWAECSPTTVGGFSAVGFHFGRLLHQTLGVPVGLIDNAWGGSAAEAWVRRDLLEKDPRFAALMAQWKNTEATYTDAVFEKEMAAYKTKLAEWTEARNAAIKAGQMAADAATAPRAPRNPLTGQGRPGNLYAGCLHPIIGYGIKGAVWYQGESNAGRAFEYRYLFPLMIQHWREEWKQGDFPFYWVQLADFKQEKAEPEESDWAELREAQTLAMKLPNTGECVITDLGEANDIHPKDKQDVAARLVRWALAKDYGLKMPYASPQYKEMKIEGNKVILTFDHAEHGLRLKDIDEAKGFSICGEDHKWVWAKATLLPDNKQPLRNPRGNQIEVSSPSVAKPVAVRYAWADNPIANVVSPEGLPLNSFRTDDFPMITDPKNPNSAAAVAAQRQAALRELQKKRAEALKKAQDAKAKAGPKP